MASRVFLETCLFAVLLVLLGVQVVVYWYCNDTTLTDQESQYGIDKASVRFARFREDHLPRVHGPETETNLSLTVTMRSHNCLKCSFQYVTTLVSGANFTFLVDSTHPIAFRIYHNETKEPLMNFSRSFEDGSAWCCELRCNLNTWMHWWSEDDTGSNAYLPILYVAVVIMFVSLFWVLLSFVVRYGREKGYGKFLHLNFMDRLTHRDLGVPISSKSGSFRKYGTMSGDTQPLLTSSFSSDPVTMVSGLPVEKTAAIKSKRLVSLDTLRGFSLMIMIFVNYGGGGYWFFDHSKWNGLTVADLVFPWFVWIMGVSLVFSFKGRKKDSLALQLYQIVRRTVILFAVGLFLSTSDAVSLSDLRVPGVLQRFAATYMVVALTEAFSSRLYNWKSSSSRSCWAFRVKLGRTQENQSRGGCGLSCDLLKDVLNNWVQWLVVLLLELLWLLLTFLVHGNGCPRGYLGPGGISHNGSYFNCTGGAAGLIDQWLLGNNHLYDDPTAKELYHLQLNYDPEGVLGTLNSIVLCFLGVQAGKVFLFFKGRHAAIILRLVLWGVASCLLGTILCLGQKNDGWIPINKNMWSLSFILLMGGTGFLLLSFFYFTVDATRWWNGSPFRYPGTNSIIVYVGHILLGGYFPFDIYQQERSHLTYLTANVVAVCVWMLIAFYWYSIGFFVKI